MSHSAVAGDRKLRVLVTGAGGPAAQSFMSAFVPGEIDWFTADADRLAPGFQLSPPNRRVIVPRGDAPDYVDTLLPLAVRIGADVIVPTVDTELVPIATARDRFDQAGIKLLMARRYTFDLTLDKWMLARHLRNVVVPIPHTTLLEGQVEIPPRRFPLIAKPRTGSGSRGIVLTHSQADVAALPRDGSYLLQEFLPGAEYSVDVLARQDGTIACAVPRERIRIDSGIAVAARTVRDAELVEYATNSARAIGLIGVANVQLKRNAGGIPALVEINPRFPGTMSLTVAAGVNMPRLALDDLLGHTMPESIDFTDAALVRTWQDHAVDPASLDASDAAERVVAA